MNNAMRRITLAAVLMLSATAGYAKDYFQSAQAYQERGESSAAVIELKNLLRDQPDHGGGRLLLGELYLAQGNFPGAEKELSYALALNGADPRLPLLLARSLLGQGRFQQAGQRLGPQAPREPSLASEYWVLKGEIFRAEGALPDAEAAYHRALALEASPAAQAGLIGLALLRRQPDHALELIADFNTQTSTFKRLAGEAYLLKRQPQPALQAYREGLALQPDDLQAALGQVRALLLQGDHEQARTLLDPILQRAPQWPRALVLSATLHLQKKEAAQVKEIIDPLLARSPQSPELLYLAALGNLGLGNLEQATQQLNQYVSRRDDRGARLTLANVYQRQNQMELARQTLAPLLDADAPDGDAYALLGAIHLQQGDADGAADAFRLSLEEGGNQDAARPLALSELLSGDSQTGIERLETLAAREADPKTDALLIRAYLVKQQTEKARQLLAQRLEGEGPKLLYRLIAASLEIRLNDLDAAEKHLDQALAEAPRSSAALLGKARIATQRSQLPAAEVLYQRAMASAPDDLAPVQGYAELLFVQEKPEQGVDLVSAYMKRADRDLAATRFYLGTLERARLTQRLDDALQEAIARFPQAPELKLASANLAYSQNDKRDADRQLDALNRQHPNFGPGHIAKSRRLLANGEYRAARMKLDALPLPLQNHPDILLLQGDALYGEEKIGAARGVYQRAYDQAPSPEALGRLTRLDVAQGNAEQAVARLQQHLEAYPGDMASAMGLAGLHLRHGNQDAAIGVYRQVTETQPDYGVAWNNLAWLYQQQSDPRAVKAAARALELQPSSAAVMDTSGWIFLDAGRIEEALGLLTKAAKGLPENLSVQYHYAVALARNGQVEAARAVVSSLLAADFPEKAQAVALSRELADLSRGD